MDNGTRLDRALDVTTAHFASECGVLRPNESAWSMYVVEPVLEVLGWPRRMMGELGDGAHFEWPEDKAADAALISEGSLLAFGEFKQWEYGCRRDIIRHRDKFSALGAAGVAFASWFSEGGGFAVYQIEGEASLCPIDSDASVPQRLANLAKPVLLGQQSAGDWLNAPASSCDLPQPRFSARAIQTHFFARLSDHLGLPLDRPFRHRAIVDLATEADDGTPSITFAHKDLHPALPKGWGVTLSVDPIRNIVACNFFERDVRALKGHRCHFTFDRLLDFSIMDAFVDGAVLETIRKREATARERGLL